MMKTKAYIVYLVSNDS